MLKENCNNILNKLNHQWNRDQDTTCCREKEDKIKYETLLLL